MLTLPKKYTRVQGMMYAYCIQYSTIPIVIGIRLSFSNVILYILYVNDVTKIFLEIDDTFTFHFGRE
jgi:hypothetical protein